jgi:hypothetical protein
MLTAMFVTNVAEAVLGLWVRGDSRKTPRQFASAQQVHAGSQGHRVNLIFPAIGAEK